MEASSGTTTGASRHKVRPLFDGVDAQNIRAEGVKVYGISMVLPVSKYMAEGLVWTVATSPYGKSARPKMGFNLPHTETHATYLGFTFHEDRQGTLVL